VTAGNPKRGNNRPAPELPQVQVKEGAQEAFKATIFLLESDEKFFMENLLLLDALRQQEFLGKNDLWNLFGNLQQLLDMHKLFFGSISQAIEQKPIDFPNWSGLVLASIFTFVPVYAVYIKNLPVSMFHLQEIEKNEDSKEFIEWFNNKLREPEYKNQTYPDLVKIPCVRLVQFAEWIKKFVDFGTAKIPEFETAVSQLNTLITQYEGALKTTSEVKSWNYATLEKKFKNKVELVVKHRKLLLHLEDITLKQKEQPEKKINFFLFNDIFVLAEVVGSNFTVVAQPSFETQEISVKQIQDEENVIRISSKDFKCRLHLKNEKDSTAFIEALKKRIEHFKKLKGTKAGIALGSTGPAMERRVTPAFTKIFQEESKTNSEDTPENHSQAEKDIIFVEREN